MLAVLLSSVLTVAFNIRRVEPQTREVGVQVGDWAKYGVTQGYDTDDPLPLSDFRLAFSNLKYSYLRSFRVEVLSVTGTNITFQVTSYCGNGTEMSNVDWMDVSSSVGPPLPFFTEAVLFVAADLTVGDQLVPNPMSRSVNATVTETCVGVEREVNRVISATAHSLMGPLPSKDMYIINSETCMFLDRATGVLVEANDTVQIDRVEVGPYLIGLPDFAVDAGYHCHTETWTQIVMTETNMWSPPVPSWLQWQLYVAVAVVIVSLGAVIYLLKKRKPRVTTPSPLESADKISSAAATRLEEIW